MELLLCLALLVTGGVAWAKWRQRRPPQQHLQQVVDHAERQRRLKLERHRQRQNALARQLQIALIQLGQAPDFRRAASIASACQEVPVAFRQRQYRRFRAKLVSVFAARLQSGADKEALTHSLAELLRQLGVAVFEAEYIQTDALRTTRPRQQHQRSYEQRLRELQQQHEARRAAIRTSISGDQPEHTELREQMTEAEEQRHREAMLALFDEVAPQPAEGPRIDS